MDLLHSIVDEGRSWCKSCPSHNFLRDLPADQLSACTWCCKRLEDLAVHQLEGRNCPCRFRGERAWEVVSGVLFRDIQSYSLNCQTQVLELAADAGARFRDTMTDLEAGVGWVMLELTTRLGYWQELFCSFVGVCQAITNENEARVYGQSLVSRFRQFATAQVPPSPFVSAVARARQHHQRTVVVVHHWRSVGGR